MEQDTIIKLCVVGEPAVGKTSMLYQYVFKKFDQNSRPTIGCDFSSKLKSSVDGSTIRLHLWDIAGKQKYNAVSKMYIRGALGCIVVCSAQEEKTLEQTMKWKKIIDQNCERDAQNRCIPSLLVQNKVDLVDPSQLKEFQKKSYLDDWAAKNDFCGVCLTSAKDNKNIEECFQQLLGTYIVDLDQIIKRGLIKDINASNTVADTATSGEKGSAKVKLTANVPRTESNEKCC